MRVDLNNAIARRRLVPVALCLCALLAGGCSSARLHSLNPPLRKRPVEDLFQEAVYQSLPEQNLGLQNVPFEQFRGPGLPEVRNDAAPQPPVPQAHQPQSRQHQVAQPLELPPLTQQRIDQHGSRKAGAEDIHPVLAQQDSASTDQTRHEINFGARKRTANSGAKRIVQVSHMVLPAAANATLVNEFFEETDVRQAIQSMAAQAGISVIMDDRVSGVVSVVLEDEPFEQALRKTLLPLGLIYKEQADGTYLVGIPDPSSPLFPLIAERHNYEPQHIDPDELVDTLPERLAVFVRVVKGRNNIAIDAPADIAASILRQLQESDQPVPQVVLEAIICVVSPDSGFRFGLDWEHAVELNEKTVMDLGLTGLAFNGTVSPAGLKNMFNDFAFTSAFVQLLAQEGYLSIRASPRVMALNGQRAEISIIRQTFFSTQPLVSGLIYRTDIREVEAGIELAIIPTIRGRNVHVQIEKAEVSEDIRTQQTDMNLVNNPFPIINRRRVTTNVTVEDGKTIVIGGLVARQTVDRTNSIPGLSALPKIGGLFQTIEKQDRETEVVIFISPKVMHPVEGGLQNYCPPQTQQFP